MSKSTTAVAPAQTVPGGKTAVRIALTFGEEGQGYIGLPYWPELATLINIGKEIHPKLKGAKREQALQAELDKRGLTKADYDRLVLRSQRKFYTADDNDLGAGEIVIPRHVLTGMMVQTVKRAPKNAVPQINTGLLHVAFQLKDGWLTTGKTKNDAKIFSRFVKNEQSNQRRYEQTPYIYDFVATGTALIDESLVSADDLFRVFEFGGRYVGVGSARDQGYGRFLVNAWDNLSDEGGTTQVAQVVNAAADPAFEEYVVIG
jgi:hypothetical protein